MNIENAKVSDILVNGFVVSVLLLSTGAFIYESSGGLVSLMPRLAWILVYGVTFLLVVMRGPQCARVVARDKHLLVLLGIALLSVFWSVEPGVTVRRGVELMGTTLFGIYLATRYDMRELLRLLAWALGIAALLSSVFALALPSYGIGYGEAGAAWQGIYGHKNILGRAMALSILVFIGFALGGRRYRWVAWAGCGLSIVPLVLSDSVAPTVCVITTLALLPFYMALRAHYSIATLSLIIAILVGGIVTTLLLSNTEGALEILGRDATLTGRTKLWDAVLEMIWQRPWLGYGYGAFWLGWEGESAHVWRMSGIIAAHPHNGLLSLWLDLGLLGVLVFVFGFLLAARRAVAWVRLTKTAEGLWPLVYLTFMLVYNTTEGHIPSYNDIIWILYVAAVLSTFPGDARVRISAHAGATLSRTTLSRRTGA